MTIEDLQDAVCDLVSIAEEYVDRKYFEELDNKGVAIIDALDEFRELKKKATAKKVVYRKQSYGTPWLCPNCEADQVKVEFMSKDGSEPKKKQSFCWKCGCCIDWSEGKE